MVETLQDLYNLPNLPQEYWAPSILEEIGNQLGTFVYAKERKIMVKKNQTYVRICVENTPDRKILGEIELLTDYGSWIQKLERDSFMCNNLVQSLGCRKTNDGTGKSISLDVLEEPPRMKFKAFKDATTLSVSPKARVSKMKPKIMRFDPTLSLENGHTSIDVSQHVVTSSLLAENSKEVEELQEE